MTLRRIAKQGVIFTLGLLALAVGAIGSAEAMTPSTADFGGTGGAQPLNDDLAGAAPIGELPFTVSTDTTMATTELDEPVADCPGFTDVSNTVWYSYTPKTDEHVRIDTIGSDFVSAVAVYSGSSLAELVLVSCGFPGLDLLATATDLVFEARAGEPYLIQVGGFLPAEPFAGERLPRLPGWQPRPEPATPGASGAGAGSLTLNLAEFAMPACPAPVQSFGDPADDTIGVEALQHDVTSLGVGLDEDVLCLSVEFEGPVGSFEQGEELAAIVVAWIDTDADPATGLPDIFSGFCPPSGLGSDALVTTAPGFGLLAPVLSLDEFTSQSFATASYDGTTIALAIPLSTVGNDPDLAFGALVGTIPEPTDCVPNGGSIDCEAGVCSVTPPPPAPPNDDFESAQVIAGAPLSKAASTAAATTQIGEPASCAGIARTVWYSYTPGQDSSVAVDTFGSNFDTVIAVYTGDELASLVNVGCNDDSGGFQSRLEFAALAGETYYIQAGGFFGDAGELTLNVAAEVVAQPGDVDCDGTTNSIDAAYVLQYGAGLLPFLLCPEEADVNQDGVINSIDATLILQFTAGLLDSLSA